MNVREHATPILVRAYHADAHGHVHHARYLEFLEEARWRLLEERIDVAALARSGLGFVVVNANVDFRRPALVGERLEVRSRLLRLGERSGVLNQKILLGSESALVVDADITFVLVSLETGKPAAMSRELREAFGPPAEGREREG